MANPSYPSDGQNERVDAVVTASGLANLKLGIGSVTPSGATTPASWHGVATHVEAATSGATDGIVVIGGKVAAGAAVVHSLLVDAAGRPIVVGAAVAGAAVTGNPVLVGGSDGTNAQNLSVDTSGRVKMVGAVAAGNSATGVNPVLNGGSDGTNVRPLAVDTSGNLNVIGGESSHATYVASVTNIAATAAMQIIVIEAPSASKVYIRRVILWNIGTDTSAGVVDFQLVRTTTAGTGGTLTPAQMDTADSAYGGIVRSNPSPAGTLGTVIFHMTMDVNNTSVTQAPYIFDFDGGRLGKSPVIPAGVANGIAFYSPGATGAAALAVSIEFSL